MRLLAQILLRQARIAQPSNPRDWLETLQTTKWTDVNKQNGQIIGSSVNGKSIQLQALPGTSIADIMMATEIALQTIDAGLTNPVTRTVAVMR